MKRDSRENKTDIEYVVLQALKRHGLTSLVTGLSGGADSVALLYSLKKISDRHDVKVRAVHCNFHLRGAESERDERFCRDLCSRIEIPLEVFQCPVSEWRQWNRGSDEMACREMRYSCFARVVKNSGADAVAIAHNSDDNAETFFINLMRGAGTKGLGGMDEYCDGIFRPLLCVSRKQIEQYLEESGISHVTDSTNLETVYRRNFIRHKILPVLEEEWPEARRKICGSMGIIRRENSIVEWTLERLVPYGSKEMKRETVDGFPDTVSLFRHFLKPFATPAVLVKEIAGTVGLPYAGRKWTISPDATLWEERDGWKIASYPDSATEREDSTLQKNEHVLTRDLMENSIRCAPLTECWTDSTADLEWRPWEKGDRIYPLGMKGSRLVSDILHDAKVPNSEKSSVFVLTFPKSAEVIWIPGLKRSRKLLVSSESKSVTRYFIDNHNHHDPRVNPEHEE